MAALERFPSFNTSADRLRSVVQNGTSRRRRKFFKHRKAHSLLAHCNYFIIKHTWTLPLMALLAFLFLYAMNPTDSNVVHHFIFLSYKLPLEVGADPSTPRHYGKGLWDIAFVSFYTVLLSFTREFIMQELLRPLAYHYDIKSRGRQARFMEQMYTALYFVVLGPAGMYIMSRTPVWYFNRRGMYESFPHKTHEAVFKFYYLFQAAYWAQQAIVLLLGKEQPRKDFKELLGHHIVALALIALSYRFHFTYMGLAVYLTHDISDFFLATSKTLNYLKNPMEGPYFGIFVGVWVCLRHYLNLRILFSLLNEFKTIGPYQLNWETQQYKCFVSHVIAFWLLAALQVLNLTWLIFILRIGYRFIMYRTAEDDRSEIEESENEETINMSKKKFRALTLVSGNGSFNIEANGVTKTVANPAVVPHTKGKIAL